MGLPPLKDFNSVGMRIVLQFESQKWNTGDDFYVTSKIIPFRPVLLSHQCFLLPELQFICESSTARANVTLRSKNSTVGYLSKHSAMGQFAYFERKPTGTIWVIRQCTTYACDRVQSPGTKDVAE